MVDAAVGDIILRILGAVGGAGGLVAILATLLYTKEERRKRKVASDAVDQDIADKVNAMLAKTAEDLDRRYKDMRNLYDAQTIALNVQIQENAKLGGKLARVIQVVKQGIEYRAGLAVANQCMADCVVYDKTMLVKIENIVSENGTQALPRSNE